MCKEIIKSVYYDRAMPASFVSKIQKDFPWLIKYVKKNSELDFQTGHDPKADRSWFSVYRGTGRVLTFASRKRSLKGYVITAADAYREIAPTGFFENPSVEGFDNYLERIRNTEKLKRYYETNKVKKEGYYQNLIARRYTFNNSSNDDFIIIDKEMVIGFKDEEVKNTWNKDIIDSQKSLIEELRKQYNGRLPREIAKEYGEYDFLAMTWSGDLIIMELKQDAPSKTALSPIQVRYYHEQLKKLMNEYNSLFENIITMINQKVELGIITIPKGKSLPKKLSGKIRTCVIVGEEDNISKTMCERYQFIRNLFLPQMEAYTCNTDGTLVESKKTK